MRDFDFDTYHDAQVDAEYIRLERAYDESSLAREVADSELDEEPKYQKSMMKIYQLLVMGFASAYVGYVLMQYAISTIHDFRSK